MSEENNNTSDKASNLSINISDTAIKEFNDQSINSNNNSNNNTPSRVRAESTSRLITSTGFSSGVSITPHNDVTGTTNNAFQQAAHGLNTAILLNTRSASTSINGLNSGTNTSRSASTSIDSITNNLNATNVNASSNESSNNISNVSKIISMTNLQTTTSTSSVINSTATSVTKNGITTKSAASNATISNTNESSGNFSLNKQFDVNTPAKVNSKFNNNESRSTSANSTPFNALSTQHELNDTNTSFAVTNKNVKASPIVSNVPSKFTALPIKSTPRSPTPNNSSDLSSQISDLKNSINIGSTTPGRSISRNNNKDDSSFDKSDNLHPKYPVSKTLNSIPTSYV